MLKFLRNNLIPCLAAILAGFLAGCETAPAQAVLTPAKTSNAATRQSIKEARADIKFSQAKAAVGASALEKADANLNQLLSAPATTTPRSPVISTSALRLTDKPDPIVKTTQEQLIKAGYLKGPADGYAGPATNDALKRYQARTK